MTTDDLQWLGMGALEELLAAGPVHLSAAGAGGDAPWVTVTALAGRRPRVASGDELADVLLELAGRPVVKPCPGCGGGKRRREFSRDAGQPDGRCRCCKECEKGRLRAYKGRRREEKKRAA